jgi:hypothetical protein
MLSMLNFHKLTLFFFLFAPTLEHRADFSVSLIIFTDGISPWTGDQLVAKPLPKHKITKHRINANTHQAYMPYVRFEPTIQVSERAKTVHALDRSATVTGRNFLRSIIILAYHSQSLKQNFPVRFPHHISAFSFSDIPIASQ